MPPSSKQEPDPMRNHILPRQDRNQRERRARRQGDVILSKLVAVDPEALDDAEGLPPEADERILRA